MLNKTLYPLHTSLKNSLRTVDAPLLALRLVRRLETVLNIGSSEVELLLVLAPKVNPVDIEDLYRNLHHLSKPRVKKLVSTLLDLGLICKTPASKDVPYLYSITRTTRIAIECIDKSIIS